MKIFLIVELDNSLEKDIYLNASMGCYNITCWSQLWVLAAAQ
jgi:hypothetical protein